MLLNGKPQAASPEVAWSFGRCASGTVRMGVNNLQTGGLSICLCLSQKQEQSYEAR